MQLLKGILPMLALRICRLWSNEKTFSLESNPTEITFELSVVIKSELTLSLCVLKLILFSSDVIFLHTSEVVSKEINCPISVDI